MASSPKVSPASYFHLPSPYGSGLSENTGSFDSAFLPSQNVSPFAYFVLRISFERSGWIVAQTCRISKPPLSARLLGEEIRSVVVSGLNWDAVGVGTADRGLWPRCQKM